CDPVRLMPKLNVKVREVEQLGQVGHDTDECRRNCVEIGAYTLLVIALQVGDSSVVDPSDLAQYLVRLVDLTCQRARVLFRLTARPPSRCRGVHEIPENAQLIRPDVTYRGQRDVHGSFAMN